MENIFVPKYQFIIIFAPLLRDAAPYGKSYGHFIFKWTEDILFMKIDLKIQ